MTLEELLNKLIQMGWKPRGENEHKKYVCNTYSRGGEIWTPDEGTHLVIRYFTLNDLCSIESGLWDFVCGLGLATEYIYDYRDEIHIIQSGCDFCSLPSTLSRYWIMMSSIEEDKIKFLLDNILLPTK